MSDLRQDSESKSRDFGARIGSIDRIFHVKSTTPRLAVLSLVIVRFDSQFSQSEQSAVRVPFLAIAADESFGNAMEFIVSGQESPGLGDGFTTYVIDRNVAEKMTELQAAGVALMLFFAGKRCD